VGFSPKSVDDGGRRAWFDPTVSTFVAQRDLDAPPALVWDVLSDYSAMTLWAGAASVHVERPGLSEPHGVGAIRVLRSWRGSIREEITTFEPGRRLSYRILSGVPVRGYQADIDLRPAGRGTQLRWCATYRARTLAAPVVALMTKLVLRDMVEGFVAAVGARATAG
jgi:uncharacterized protein YndB with AHSA1/START domain